VKALPTSFKEREIHRPKEPESPPPGIRASSHKHRATDKQFLQLTHSKSDQMLWKHQIIRPPILIHLIKEAFQLLTKYHSGCPHDRPTYSAWNPLQHATQSAHPDSKQQDTKEEETLRHRNGPLLPCNRPPRSLMLERRALELQENKVLQVAREITPKNAIHKIYYHDLGITHIDSWGRSRKGTPKNTHPL